MGSYIEVYQRPGEDPMLDLNFFEGNRSIVEASKLSEALVDAVKISRRWKEKKDREQCIRARE